MWICGCPDRSSASYGEFIQNKRVKEKGQASKRRLPKKPPQSAKWNGLP